MNRARLLGVVTLVASLLAVGQAHAAENLNGEGESWPEPAVQKLLIGARNLTSPFSGQFIDAGEATGKDDVAAGSADFAIAGAALTPAQRQVASHAGRSIVALPYAVGAVAFVAALDVDDAHGGGRIEHLNLSVPTLAKIFTHAITTWNDPEIRAENPTEPRLQFLKVLGIYTVPRIDSSSSTAAVISLFLSDPEARTIWNAYAKSPAIAAPADTPLDQWPNDPNTQTKSVSSGCKGVLDSILVLNPATEQRFPGAASHHIGYVSPSWALKYNAPMVTILSNDGVTKIDPTHDSVAKALSAGTYDPTTHLVTLKYGVTASGAYPAPLVSYFLVPTKGLTSAKAKAMSGLLKYSFSSAGQNDVSTANYVPVTPAMRSAGLSVAAALVPKAGSPGTTHTSPHSSGGGSGTNVQGSFLNNSSGSGGLPRTGLPVWPVAVSGAVLLGAGEIVRRRLLRSSS